MLYYLEEDYLPLYLIIGNGCMCYVIDNQVQLIQIGGWLGQYPFNAYYQLNKLFCSEKTANFLPKKLQYYLSCNFQLPAIELHKYLSGYIGDDSVNSIISLETEITDHPFRPVTLKNIQYQEGYNTVTKFGSHNLSFKEAFFLFANILTNSHTSLFGHSETTEELTFDNHPNWFHGYWFKQYGEDYIRLVNFNHFYYQYLKNELLSGKITPYEIAFYSGTTTLASFFELEPVEDFTKQAIKDLSDSCDLSRNRKIIYYCFLLEVSNNYLLKEKYNLNQIPLLDEFKSFIFG